MSAVEDQMHLAREKASADAEYYKAKKEGEGNSALFTKAYLRLEKVRSLTQNSQIYFGDQIPSTLLTQAMMQNNQQNKRPDDPPSS